ncbi:hypothetical protein C2I06_23710 [Niallia circulans]|uniref:hypothetical protein n=1 Tax=Niallia circulans TaxID=1397 RepID=UPI0002F29536|nr:hypothetical protein [Niallia circulans]AYV69598.1 hypothetical protein C2I06_23710 [Niallia circulans]
MVKKFFYLYLYSNKYYMNLIIRVLENKNFNFFKKHIIYLAFILYAIFFLFTVCVQILAHNMGNTTIVLQNIFILAFLAMYSILLTTNLDMSIIRGFVESNISVKNRYIYLLIVESYIPFCTFIFALLFQLPVIIGQSYLNGSKGIIFNLHFIVFLFMIFLFITSLKMFIQSIKLIWDKYNLIIMKEIFIFLLSIGVTLFFDEIVYVVKNIITYFIKFNMNVGLNENKFLNSFSFYNYNYARELKIMILFIIIFFLISYCLNNKDITKVYRAPIRTKSSVLSILFSRFGLFNQNFISCVVLMNILNSPIVKKIIGANGFLFFGILSLSLFTKYVFGELDKFIYLNKLSEFRVALYFSFMHIISLISVCIFGIALKNTFISIVDLINLVITLICIDLIYFWLFSTFIKWIKSKDSLSEILTHRIINFASIIPFLIYSIIKGVTYAIALF